MRANARMVAAAVLLTAGMAGRLLAVPDTTSDTTVNLSVEYYATVTVSEDTITMYVWPEYYSDPNPVEVEGTTTVTVENNIPVYLSAPEQILLSGLYNTTCKVTFNGAGAPQIIKRYAKQYLPIAIGGRSLTLRCSISKKWGPSDGAGVYTGVEPLELVLAPPP